MALRRPPIEPHGVQQQEFHDPVICPQRDQIAVLKVKDQHILELRLEAKNTNQRVKSSPQPPKNAPQEESSQSLQGTVAIVLVHLVISLRIRIGIYVARESVQAINSIAT
jgi:hypothetical protein